ncbi:MAG: cytochrome c biogenesis protein CcsA, partial [Anaerolineae bacterium]|nr:cytochrome c biogenesis protein CcsA [Anaerolineae bacterium]
MTLVVSLAGVGLALVGAFTHRNVFLVAARNAILLTVPLLSLVAGLLIYAQVNGGYEIVYVNNVSKDAQPLALKITALWGGQAGSLVFWSLMLSGFVATALLLNWRQERHLMPWLIVAGGGTLAFFVLLSNFYENPFERFWALEDGSVQTALLRPEEGAVVAYPFQSSSGQQLFHVSPDGFFPGDPTARFDGHGLNPLLRHPGMIIHPPLLYLGFTGFIIPFAFAIGALATGDLGMGWLRATRRWSLIAWMFLSLGLILGGRWAYDVLGWGGYWGWDPVENSSLLPWLTGTAFLHSVMIQEKRGMLKGWNVVMILLTYLLVLFGTVATRTGLLSSVHSLRKARWPCPWASSCT